MAQTFNVFIPNELLEFPSGYLTGCVSSSNGMICVLGISQHMTTSQRIIGYWSTNSRMEETILNDLKSREEIIDNDNIAGHFILLKKYSTSNDISCEFCEPFRKNDDYETHAVVIYFEPYDILQSYIFRKSESQAFMKSLERSKAWRTIDNVINDDTLGGKLAAVISSFLQVPRLSGEVLLCKGESKSVCIPNRLVWTLSQMLIWIFSCFWCPRSRARHLGEVFSFSNVCQLLHEKKERCNKVSSLCKDKGSLFNNFITYNVSAQHLCDCLAGTAMLYFILSSGLTNLMAFSTLDWADDVAGKLKNLTLWLMGAPAGLKLNAELTNFLGHFYIYHIYVWTGYLMLLRAFMPFLISLGAWSGVFGLSFQLCFIKDIISLLTVHIYCFYVYAARIFDLQINALGSLWKLFRGKKWNVLRCRVDSAEYDTDQLFIGTLMFTVLLFLLPTTLLYYAVFTALRLLTVTAQGLLSHIVAFINDLPVYTLVLKLFRPKLIAGTTFFKMINSSNDCANLVLSMETSQLPFGDVISLTAPYLNRPTKCMHSWGSLLSCIATGKLIYPWADLDAPFENDGGVQG